MGSRYAQGDVELYVNGRVVSSPDTLRENIRSSIDMSMKESNIANYDLTDDCFSPGRPNPTYRMKA